MINFKVIKIRNIVKNLVKLGILLISIVIITRFFYLIPKVDLKTFIEKRKDELNNKTFIECLDENLDNNYIKNQKNEENIISKEFEGVIFSISNDIGNINQEEDKIENLTKETVSDVNDNKTTIVEENNKKEIYNVTYSSVKIRNQTSVPLTKEMLRPDLDFDKNNIIIFHTHTSESYTQSDNYKYVPSGNFRTLNTNCNVVGVGNELTERLKEYGINVIHDTTVHDYPEYNGAYTRSLDTVQNILKNNKSDFIIDLHRDAMAESSYGPSIMIGDEKVAQLMFVLGSDEGGLSHPNWNQNLKIAIRIQEKANELYPGLFKPILLTKYRYNEHLAKGACIIEVGATGNTMEECLNSMKYLAEVISKVN